MRSGWVKVAGARRAWTWLGRTYALLSMRVGTVILLAVAGGTALASMDMLGVLTVTAPEIAILVLVVLAVVGGARMWRRRRNAPTE